MKTHEFAWMLALLIVPSVASASNLEKQSARLDRELRSISLTATVGDGRRVVNRLMAEQLDIPREQLVRERKLTGFAYGQLFGAHEAARLRGLTFNQVAVEMKQGISIVEISQGRAANLQLILADARRLNKRIDRRLGHRGDDRARGKAGLQPASYDPADDSLSGDADEFSAAEIVLAQSHIHRRSKRMARSRGAGSASERDAGWARNIRDETESDSGRTRQ